MASNYTTSMDPEGTAKVAQQGGAWASDQLAQRATSLQQMHTATQSLGHWAQEFKDQMGHPEVPGSGTLASAHAAGHRVYGKGYGGYGDHYDTMAKTAQVLPQADQDAAAKLQTAVESQT